MDDDDIMGGLQNNLSDPEADGWAPAEPALSGSRRRNYGGRNRKADPDDDSM